MKKDDLVELPDGRRGRVIRTNLTGSRVQVYTCCRRTQRTSYRNWFDASQLRKVPEK